jgi:uncharacterized ion transporter superfamily protein YfcC
MDDNSGCLGCLGCLGLLFFLSICLVLYVSGFGWFFYTTGGIFIVLGLIRLKIASQLKEEAKLPERLSEELHNNWK